MRSPIVKNENLIKPNVFLTTQLIKQKQYRIVRSFRKNVHHIIFHVFIQRKIDFESLRFITPKILKFLAP